MNAKLLFNQKYQQDINQIINHFKGDLKKFAHKKILVTGGLGLVGSSIVDVLIINNFINNCDCHIFVGARDERAFEARYSDVKNVHFLKYDSFDFFNPNETFDYIICCAGIANPDEYVSSPVETFRSTYDGVSEILKYSLKNIETKILFISSSEVYGTGIKKEKIQETDCGCIDFENVRSSYAMGKISSEALCRAYFSEYKTNVYIARLGFIFGPSASKNDKRVSSLFCYRAINHEPLVLYSDGSQKRSYLYSLDCASALLIILLNGKIGETYNVGHAEETSIKKLCEFIAQHTNCDLKIGSKQNKKMESNPMNNSVLDSSKLFSLGFKPVFSIKESIEHTIDIIKEMEK